MPASPSTTALVLQGGGALGAYQAGVYEALAAADWQPDWIAGISIGAINGALIAGNPPERRVERLHAFWDRVSARLRGPALFAQGPLRRWHAELSAGITAATGLPGFFTPRLLPPALAPAGSAEAISIYDTAPLAETLRELVDFERINTGPIRFSVGAVNIATGNFAFFDNRDRPIGPEHVMASGALPPGFAPVEIEGELYWDGGLVSNTPLQHLLDNHAGAEPLTVFQVDLFPARGAPPRTLGDVTRREKDIRFSSRTRLNTDLHRELAKLRAAGRRLAAKLPPELRADAYAAFLASQADPGPVTILQLINRADAWETQAKDYEFSRVTIDGHWAAGRADVEASLAHPDWTGRPSHASGIVTLDLTETEAG